MIYPLENRTERANISLTKSYPISKFIINFLMMIVLLMLGIVSSAFDSLGKAMQYFTGARCLYGY